MTAPTSPDGAPTGRDNTALVVVGSLIALVLVTVGVVAIARSTDSDESAVPTTTSTSTTTTATSTTTTSTTTTTTTTTTTPPADGPVGDAVGPTIPELARATVLLVQLDGTGQPACFSGSGSIVDPSGQILTNAHVVENDPFCPYEQLGVALTDATDEPPELTFLADVVAFDTFLDLAVVRISRTLDGAPVDGLVLPFVARGDSDATELGDDLRILGFPGIGGDTITFTEGSISGFVGQPGVETPRAWIKTDATIAGGNSGGMAVNEQGELVGVPTQAGAGDSVTTDCRVIEDTNGDGRIDDTDSCIPIGGFINGLRPVNLATTLLLDAVDADPIVPVVPDVDPDVVFDPEVATAFDLVFTPEIVDDAPTAIVTSLGSGPGQICAHWAYDGLSDGLSYDLLWRVDGEPDIEGSFLGETWFGGVAGTWWACIFDDAGLADGLYEFEFTVEETVLATEAIFVGDDRAPASLTIENQSGAVVCFVQISPTLAGYWGPDELGPTEVIAVGSARRFELVVGSYDVRLSDCDGEVVEEIVRFEVTADETLVHSGS